ncbi:MAG: hypothetical protein WA971_03355, partial [Microbacterium sp.]
MSASTLDERRIDRMHRRNRARARLGNGTVHAVLWVYAAIAIVPLIVMVLNSFRTSKDLFSDPLGLPLSPTVQGYVKAWTDASFATYFFNSLFVTVTAVALSTAVSVLAAYALARWKFRGASLLESLFISGLMIPIMLAMLPMF